MTGADITIPFPEVGREAAQQARDALEDALKPGQEGAETEKTPAGAGAA